MRDVIWTIIVIWLVWKIYNIFKLNSSGFSNRNNSQAKNDTQPQSKNIKDKFADAEYVDYEEIK